MSQSTFPSPQQPRITASRLRFASLRSVLALVLREMSTTHGRSPGGYVWAVLEPVAAITLLTLIFSVGFKSPSIGVNFPIFYATGMIPFSVFMDISSKVAGSLMFSKALLAYPKVTFVDAILGRLIVATMTQLMVSYVVFVGILMAFDTRTAPVLPVIATTYAMVVVLALGVGTLNCFLMTTFPVWQRVWSVLTRPLFIISCIFFVFDTIPHPYRDYLWFNPLVHVVGYMRHGFYPSYDAPYVSLLYVFGLGLGMMVIGLVFLRHYHRDLLNGS
ncbi:ABC transporter permease [Fertoebacter nigrum]|uniref:Transport permease protein n=1 Tax=Fertoeibacter niger TaxID=2656921 RepID=A0A8X8KQQ5_9RHOB|nr:ABC transporter permease [Fertoeibacter niger]NUB46500.1 ABC transporter permease [Fertoeibacter niger]